MTRAEFDETAEIWYQRTHRLREYSEDENNPSIKRVKAMNLFFIMLSRMTNVFQIAIKLDTPKPKLYPGALYRGGKSN